MSLIKSLVETPGYTLMRGPARFGSVRDLVTATRRWSGGRDASKLEATLQERMTESPFAGSDADEFVAQLNRDGCAFGLQLPADDLAEIRNFADDNTAYAFRDPAMGFHPDNVKAAERALSDEILLSQYFNVQRNCSVVERLARDPWLNLVALRYIGSVPRFAGVNLWWTYPVTPNRQAQMKHAHVFHRDIDDFKFLKFFFYITDVESGDGGHWLVAGSHRKSPHLQFKDRFVTRRFEDDEIADYYQGQEVLEITGQAGTGFAEDTLCVHKGSTPVKEPRLILQLQFGLFGLIPENDEKAESELGMIPGLVP